MQKITRRLGSGYSHPRFSQPLSEDIIRKREATASRPVAKFGDNPAISTALQSAKVRPTFTAAYNQLRSLSRKQITTLRDAIVELELSREMEKQEADFSLNVIDVRLAKIDEISARHGVGPLARS
jgi:hypothetical protein